MSVHFSYKIDQKTLVFITHGGQIIFLLDGDCPKKKKKSLKHALLQKVPCEILPCALVVGNQYEHWYTDT